MRAPVLTFFRRQNGRAFFPSLPIAALLPRSWRWADSTSAAWDGSPQLGYFCNAKGQRDFISTLAFSASHEACRRMAVFSTQLTRKLHQTREPWHPLCHGDKIPANPHVLLHPCAAPPRSSGSRGTAPCASRGTCRATAVKPRPSRMSPYTPARIARSPKGAQPPCRRELGSLPSRRTARK